MRLLIIDDDMELCGLLQEFLQREGFQVSCSHNGRQGLEDAQFGAFDLVILDVMLPGLDGLEVLRRLRQRSRVPVIMLTARGQDIDRIRGLESGADDYLPKPFNTRELVARVNAILRRLDAGDSKRERVEVNGIIIDTGRREVYRGSDPVDVTTFEFDILEMLMRASGQVLSRDALMERLYNRRATPYDRSIDMHISHLRKKLETGEQIIKTIRGVGYQFSSGHDSGERADEAAEG